MAHFVIDTETLDTVDSAIILSIGILKVPENISEMNFSEVCEKGLYIKLDREQQVALGRTAGKDTLDWWQKQGDSARDVLSNKNCVPLKEAYGIINEYLIANSYDKKNDIIWSRGLIDSNWIQHLYEKTLSQIIKPCIMPFPFWIWRDSRTACHLLLGAATPSVKDVPGIEKFVKHHALMDCVADAFRLAKASE